MKTAQGTTPVIEGRWLAGYDVTEVFSRIACPVLLLQADPTAGGALTNADADAAVAALSSSQHVRFSGGGHQLHRERPEAVLHALQDFAASLPATQTISQNNPSSTVIHHS